MHVNLQIVRLLEELQKLNVLLSYTIDGKTAAINQRKKKIADDEDNKRNDLSKKLNINNGKITKDKDIITIIDNESDKNNDLDDAVKQVTVKMDGFDRIFLEQYQKMLADYQKFLSEYLNNSASSIFAPKYDYQQETGKKKEFKWGNEVVSNLEMFDVARKIMTNAAMGSGLVAAYTGNNTVNHHEREDYEMWKNSSKFNMLLSFLLYEKVMNGG
ncbi:hypothetical protein HZA96_00570 [Candidatus Woesearchaeota archaeon]|nr:hypothetical protein [Candidatus Woesearchaeota archaeon]